MSENLLTLCPAPPDWRLPWHRMISAFNWLNTLADCPQDPIHHAEGDDEGATAKGVDVGRRLADPRHQAGIGRPRLGFYGVIDERFDADLVFYLAGADPHEGDRLGRMKLSFDGLEARDRRVFDWAWQRRIPLAMSMAGGYGRDIASTLQVQRNTWAVAVAYARRWA